MATLATTLLMLSALTAGAVVAGASLAVSQAPTAMAGNGLIAWDCSGALGDEP